MQSAACYIGLMSGTSLDGVDAVALAFSRSNQPSLLGHYYLPFTPALKSTLLQLNTADHNDLHTAAVTANTLAICYADAVNALLDQLPLEKTAVTAIGCHGQTVRHRPDLGYTLQIGNAALLAELSGIAVVSDFRSRDLAAGGQGAPLVPAFHAATFGHPSSHRVIVNVGGISNLSDLAPDQPVRGYDCGPGNLLMDAWIARHLGYSYDENGAWAAQGTVIPALLDQLLAHPYLAQTPPKSTGRDTFHMTWLETLLNESHPPQDVQATLLEFTARSISDAIREDCKQVDEIYLCGGGAKNAWLCSRLRSLCKPCPLLTTTALGIPPDLVEAAAFAWLAHQFFERRPANLPEVTGAHGPRILGALYPA